MRKLLVCLALAMLATTTGCEIYFGDHGGDDDDGDAVSHYCEGSGDETVCFTCYEYDGYVECFPDTYGCASDDQCARGCYCAEGTGVCEEAGTCAEDQDCGYGLECDCSGSCVPTGTETRECQPNSCWSTGCPEGQVCTAEGTCVPVVMPPMSCQTDADCALGCYCENGECEESAVCTSDAECPQGQTCDETRMTCEPITGTCYTEAGPNCPAAPTCAAGELAEVGGNGCYTGLCLPEAVCPDEPPRPECSAINDWATCLVQEMAGFCVPVLIGTDCHPAGNPNASCAPGQADCVCNTVHFSACADHPNAP